MRNQARVERIPAFHAGSINSETPLNALWAQVAYQRKARETDLQTKQLQLAEAKDRRRHILAKAKMQHCGIDQQPLVAFVFRRGDRLFVLVLESRLATNKTTGGS